MSQPNICPVVPRLPRFQWCRILLFLQHRHNPFLPLVTPIDYPPGMPLRVPFANGTRGGFKFVDFTCLNKPPDCPDGFRG